MQRIQVINGQMIAQNTRVKGLGVNYTDAGWLWGGNGKEQWEYFKDWKMTMIRLTCPSIENAALTSYLSVLDNQILWAEQNGIYVIVTYHTWQQGRVSGWTETNWAAWIQWWQTIANRYKGKPNVLYDLLNEPAEISATTHQTRFRACIDAIRKIDSTVPIVCEGISNSSWMDIALNYENPESRSYAPINRANIVFHYHTYSINSSKSAMLSELESSGMAALKRNGKCAMLGEFGGSNTTLLRNWCEIIVDNDFDGLLEWAWLISGSYAMLSDWKGNPSSQGAVLKNFLSSLPNPEPQAQPGPEPAPDPEPTPEPTQDLNAQAIALFTLVLAALKRGK